MSGSPINHVLDFPYFAIGRDWGVVLPERVATGNGEHIYRWGVPDDQLLTILGTPLVVTVHSLSLVLVTGLLVTGAFLSVRGITVRPEKGRGLLAKLFESFIQFLRDDVIRPNLGDRGRTYTPYLITFFFLILVSNFFGMVPFGGFLVTPSTNLNFTAALAVISFFSFFVIGIRECGVWPTIKCLLPHGVPWPIWILMLPLELAGPFIKGAALALRLFANLVAGHTMLAAVILIGMSEHGGVHWWQEISWGAVVPVYLGSVAISLLECLVALLQAYIFTLLTAVFLGMFLQPSHSSSHH